jgi:hypothetical protein
MAGLTPMKIALNFKDLVDQDATGQTYFVVGGRTYYEATISGENTLSFIAKGFFDQAGYSQPAKKADGKNIAIGVSVTVVVVGLLVLACYCYKRRQDEIDRIKGVQKEEDLIAKKID